MKKIISALLILLSVTFTVSAATDVSLAFGTAVNCFSLEVDAKDNETTVSPKISLDVEADVILNRGNGFYVDLGLHETSNIWVGGGYAYKTPVGNFDMMLTVGPHFLIQGSSATMGVDFKTMFMAYFSGVDGMFASFGASVNMDFVTFGDRTEGFFNMALVVPQFAIGYRF